MPNMNPNKCPMPEQAPDSSTSELLRTVEEFGVDNNRA